MYCVLAYMKRHFGGGFSDPARLLRNQELPKAAGIARRGRATLSHCVLSTLVSSRIAVPSRVPPAVSAFPADALRLPRRY